VIFPRLPGLEFKDRFYLRRMMPLLKQLEEQARTLCPEDRARLAEIMLESLQPSTIEINSAWDEEIEHRLDAFDQGLMLTHSADAVFAEASVMLR
jgi:hypothetical protein